MAAHRPLTQAEYTKSHAMSRDDFLKKYGPTFVADNRGGNAASEVAGQNVGDFYDRYLAPGAKQTRTIAASGDSSAYETSMDWAQGRYGDSHPNFDAYDYVSPHPESQRGNGLDEAWKQVGRPIATAAAMYYGGQLLNGAAGAAGPGSAGWGMDLGAEGVAADVAGPGSAGWGMDLGAEGVAADVAGPGSAGWGMDLGAEGVAGEMGVGELSPLAEQTITPGASAVTNVTAGTDAAGVAAATSAAKGGMSLSQLAATFGPGIAKMALAALAGNALGKGEGGGGAGGSGGIDDLISGAMGNMGSMEKDYNTVFKPWAVDQVGKITARGDQGYDQLMGLSRAPNKNLDDYQAYLDRIGSDGYRDQQRGQAMGTVQQQADMGTDAARRAAMARGVDPSRFAMQQNANAINVAAAKTKAAADAEGMAWDQWGKGSQIGSGMRIADGNYRAGLVTGANTLGQNGFNAGTKLAAIDGAYRGGLNSNYAGLIGAKTGANSVANNQTNYDKEHGLGGIVTAGLASAAGKWMTDAGSKALDSAGNSVSNFFSG